MSFGFSGVHRSGKTTTAKEVAARMRLPFVATNASQVWKELGVDPSAPMSFSDRMKGQYRILEEFSSAYSLHRVFVSDRTPVDLMAYTLADIRSSNEVDHSVLIDYLNACAEVTMAYFSAILVLQPGIPYEQAMWKGMASPAYIELLNTVLRGCLSHPGISGVRSSIVHGDIVDLEERIRLGVSYFDSHRNVHLRLSQGVQKALH